MQAKDQRIEVGKKYGVEGGGLIVVLGDGVAFGFDEGFEFRHSAIAGVGEQHLVERSGSAGGSGAVRCDITVNVREIFGRRVERALADQKNKYELLHDEAQPFPEIEKQSNPRRA